MRVITIAMKNVIGVYGIRRISDGLFYYIGSSKHVWTRWLQHRNNKLNEKRATDEYVAFHKLLIDNLDDFEPVLLDELVGFIHIDDNARLHKRLVDREIMYIRKYEALGHPLVTTCENNLHTMKRTDETKQKMSASHIGVPQPWMIGDNNPSKRPEVAAKISASKMGENNPTKRPEVRAKISDSMKGKNAGQIWITNDIEERHVTEQEFKDKYEKLGYWRGRKKR